MRRERQGQSGGEIGKQNHRCKTFYCVLLLSRVFTFLHVFVLFLNVFIRPIKNLAKM